MAQTTITMPKMPQNKLRISREAILRATGQPIAVLEELTMMYSNVGEYTYRDSLPILAALDSLGFPEAGKLQRIATTLLNSEFGNFDIVRSYTREASYLADSKRGATARQKDYGPLRATCRFYEKGGHIDAVFIPLVVVQLKGNGKNPKYYIFSFAELLASFLKHLKMLEIPVTWSKKGKLTSKADVGRIALAVKRTVVTPAKLPTKIVPVFPLVEKLAAAGGVMRGADITYTRLSTKFLRSSPPLEEGYLRLEAELPPSSIRLVFSDQNTQEQIAYAREVARGLGIPLQSLG